VDAVKTKHKASSSQVAINWCRAKGTVPIPGCRTLKQVTDNYASLNWKLDAGDLKRLDAAVAKIRPLTDNSAFPEKDVFTGMRMFDS